MYFLRVCLYPVGSHWRFYSCYLLMTTTVPSVYVLIWSDPEPCYHRSWLCTLGCRRSQHIPFPYSPKKHVKMLDLNTRMCVFFTRGMQIGFRQLFLMLISSHLPLCLLTGREIYSKGTSRSYDLCTAQLNTLG